jgi:hypothetical protein
MKMKNIDQALAGIGQLLLDFQTLEFSFSMCVTFVFPNEKELSKLSFFDDGRPNRDETIGRFINLLKQRVEVHPEFDDLLKTVLERRNLFVHRVSFEDWFHLGDEKGLDEITSFINSLGADVYELNVILFAFVWYWAKRNNLNSQFEAEIKGMPVYEDAIKYAMPHLNHFIIKRINS